MSPQKINSEIEKLQKIKKDWLRTYARKDSAHELLGKISIFNHTFFVQFPAASKFYNKNSDAEIYITDGIEDLEQYANSKLKQKDDKYFYSGIKNIERGLERLIHHLQIDC